MAADRLVPTLAVAALLVLAGCAGGPAGGSGDTTESPTTPTGTPSAPTPTPGQPTDIGESNGTDTAPSGAVDDAVTVENGTLPADATLTFNRVETLTGADVDPWPVEIRNLSEWRASVQRVGAVPLNRALGFENVSTDWSEPTGVTVYGTVYVHPGDGTPARTERVLAHEYAHVVQYRTTMFPWQGRLSQPRLTTDRINARRSLVEGGAVFVADAYSQRYLDVRSNSAYARALYRNGSATTRSALSPYVFGNQYVDSRIDDPANLSVAYESYPRTTEQVIHNETPGEEPPANLSVTATAESERWDSLGNNTLGEMTTRAALDTELGRERAAAAAAGWGTDRLAVYRHAANDSRYGWAWVMRWDNASETDDLEAALSTFADAREGASSAAFRVATVDDETVALVFGDPAFVEEVEVAGRDGNVSVAA
ncbi:hypothetical protein [Haloarcula onubensis]|uniref:DUF4157 domain-containing protein n=1 Tax=Haloarcula onubensis TaxID=2950539 RepID=A0ABU2FJW3_9EURY|nr:hypothetical protein [Halomicroarcula sp. S3CR25-11]MDS0281033.1 hypothetical protein [Halomicroarcula sp. S3CR25-11]